MENTLDFDSFCRREYVKAFRYIRSHTANREEAEDLIQDIFEYCYKCKASFNPEKASESTWLYLIINSRLKNYYRDKKPTEDITLLEEVLPADETESEQAVYLQQMKDAILNALQALPQRQRDIVVYRYFNDMSHADIAKRLGISENNSRVLLARALEKLQGQLKGFECC